MRIASARASANAGKSVLRSRVEHVFADQKSRMGLLVRTFGMRRAEMKVGMANRLYNIRRSIFLVPGADKHNLKCISCVMDALAT